MLVSAASSACRISASPVVGWVARMRGQPMRLRHQAGIVHRLPDQAPGLGLLGGDRLGQQREAAGPGAAGQSRQGPCAAGIRYQADFSRTTG